MYARVARLGWILVIVAAISGCASAPTVPGSDNDSSISALWMTCSSHYPFTRDCNIWEGASRRATVAGFPVKISGTADGKAVLVMDADLWGNMVADLFTFSHASHTTASNNSYFALRRFYDAAGVKVRRARPLTIPGGVSGYVLELDRNGYDPLLELAGQK